MGISLGTFFESLVELFGMIYTSGTLLWQWLSTPIKDTFGDNAEYIGELANQTPLELMFGVGLIVILVYQLVKFIMGI